MKYDEITAALREKAAQGDTLAMAVFVISRRLSDIEEKLGNIDGVLTEMRSAIEQAA